jgi:hypothetical protein
MMSQPHFEASVRMKLTFPKVGTWSPPGLPKTQSLIAGVQTPHIEVFFIPLKRFWSVDVQNGLAPFGHLQHKLWSKERRQVDSRPLKFGNWPDLSVCAGRVRHTIGKLLKRTTTLFQTSFQSEVWDESYEFPKSRESKPRQFRDSSLGVPRQKIIQM